MSLPILVLIPGGAPDDPIEWVKVASNGEGIEARGVIESGGRAPIGDKSETVLVLSGVEAQLRVLDATTRSEAQARAAANYMFKGALAGDPDETFYAIGRPHAETGRRLIAALDRGRLQSWLTRCSEAGVNPSAIYVDCTILPNNGSDATIFSLPDRVIVSAGDRGGFAIEPALASSLIRPWLDQFVGQVTAVSAHGELPVEAAAALGPQVRLLQAAAQHGDLLDRLALAAARPPAWSPDLRQGDFAVAGKRSSPVRAWLLAASLVVLAGLLQVGVVVLDGLRDKDSVQRLLAAAEVQFHKIRPDVGRVINLRAQVTSALNGLRHQSTNPMVALSDSISNALANHPEVRLEEMRAEGPGQSVLLRLSGSLPAVLDAAVADLRQSWGRVDVGQMQTAEGRATISITMETT